MISNESTHATVVNFWRHAGPKAWFSKDAEFDRVFRETFRETHFLAASRSLDTWAESTDGTLALMILLDQYPRNSFRGTAHMFATDGLARYFASQAVDRDLDLACDEQLRPFLYLPFMHSEDLRDQDRTVRLYETRLPKADPKWAIEHRDIVARFGRFPHRNHVLGRVSTPDEEAFLAAGGFAG